ncbi:MAG: Mrp/NBP35 family ATP-binding protein, partial [Clostridiales bacterium]|nr:Mrp/NBP35 family ATP-binding protein [Clostridiales bacterium]
PGTGDVPLTVFQSLPIDGVIIVTTPQDLVGMIVAKAVNMANMMNVPVLGLVENMSYFKCPDCGKEHAIFGESKVEQIAREFGIEHTARLPIDPVIAAMVDAGEVESVSGEHIAALADYIEKGI